jgi:Uncharacterised nucleotidyltransferase
MPNPSKLAQAQQALHLTAQLLRVQDALDRASIPFLTFKGPTLSLSLYGDLGTRSYGDIDILLSATRVIEAKNELTKLGYHPHLEVDDKQLAWLTTFLNEYAMISDSAMVEIHWSVVRPGYRFSLTYEDLAPHQTTTTIAGRTIPVLKNEAMLVVLAVHGSKHGWSRRSWLTDFADLALGEKALDWNLVFEIATKHAATRFLAQASWLTKNELGRVLPAQLQRRLQPDPIARVAAKLAKRSADEGKQNYLSYVAAMSDARSRFRAFRELFIDPTPLDCQLVDLPESLFPLYHAVRPIRLIGKHVFKLRHRPWSA